MKLPTAFVMRKVVSPSSRPAAANGSMTDAIRYVLAAPFI